MEPFDVDSTQEKEFRVTPEKKVNVKMMHKHFESIPFGQNETAKWVRLHYKEREFSAVFILPQKKGDLASVKKEGWGEGGRECQMSRMNFGT